MRSLNPNLGQLALLVAAGGLLSGAFLAFHYAPTFDAAHDAVEHLETLAWGRWLRSLHHWSANVALALAALHGARLFWQGGYKTPRRGLWVLGALLALVLLGFAYTGYLLLGDERALAGLKVMEGVAGSTPVLGDAAAGLVRGGDAISSATLARLYALHSVVLPAALVLLVVAFVARARRIGEPPPAPNAKAAVAILALLLGFAVVFPPALGPKADLAGASPPDARPEWFFLWVNELLRRVPGSTFLVAGLLPMALVALAVGLPFYAKGAAREPRRRKPELAVAGLILLAITGLTAASFARTPGRPPEPPSTAGTLTPSAVMEKFQCARCHRIDGAESPDDTGPPVNRRATADHPAVKDLFTREFFRRKVGDPRKYWEGTSMNYTPPKRKPSADEIAVLERWFFGE